MKRSLKTLATAAITVMIVLGAAMMINACARASKPPKGVGTSASAVPPPAGAPYRLHRSVYRVELTPIPLARTRCWVRERGPEPNRALESALVEWDLSNNAPPTRYVTMPYSSNTAAPPVDLTCTSEQVQLGQGKDKDAVGLTYIFDEGTSEEAEKKKKANAHLKALLLGKATELGPGGKSNSALNVTAALYSIPSDIDPELTGLDAEISSNRSLDPLTPIVTELLSVVAEVAVDRATQAATNKVKNVLMGTICQLTYENGDDIDSAQLYEPSDTVTKPDAGANAKPDANQRRKVFSQVCNTLDSVRIEEIASTSKTIIRALAGDLIEYAFRKLRASHADQFLRDHLSLLEKVVTSVVDGKSVTTERDFQIMLLRLSKTPIPSGSGSASKTWRCGVGIGFAVLRECLRRTACSAEDLQSSLSREIETPDAICDDVKHGVRDGWPELSSLLSRSVDVFHPPPGTSPNQSAKVATNLFFEVLAKYVTLENKASRDFDFEQIAPLVNSVFDKDYVRAIVATTSLLVDTINASCPAEGICRVEVPNAELKKGIALLNGFISYASTYSEKPREGEKDKTDAEREKLRHDERKKAMEALIDATTDRTNRGGDVIVSLGVGVGLNVGRARRDFFTEQGDIFWSPTLSLPMGLALQGLPSSRSFVGVHAQLTLLDLGQFTNLSKDAKLPEPEIGTAAVIGGQLGLLLGGPKSSALLGLDFGYAPGLKFENDDRVGYWRLGGFVGTYIPFFDFN